MSFKIGICGILGIAGLFFYYLGGLLGMLEFQRPSLPQIDRVFYSLIFSSVSKCEYFE